MTGVPLALDPQAVLPVPVRDARLDTPAMLVDLDVCEANLAAMAGYARRAGVQLRPHVKTHKSLALARQLAAGAVGLCVATVGAAEVFAPAVCGDLTLAYPVVGPRKLSRLAAVCRAVPVTLVADSAAVVEGYAEVARRAGRTVTVLVEVGTGMHRVGVPPGSAVELAGLAARRTGWNSRIRVDAFRHSR